MDTKIGLIAGGGQFPILFAKTANEKGLQVYAAGFHNETDPQLATHTSAIEWLYLGQIKRLLKFFKKHHIRQAVMVGSITKTKMFTDVRPDIKAISLAIRMKHTHDDAVLRAFADLLEQEGIKIKHSTFLMPELLAPEGVWTKRKPSRAEYEDIRFGWKIAKEIGRLDIGQCVVAGAGTILAVEAIEGTDATIRRAGQLSNGHAIVVKVCKPIQDTRFDMPAVGVQTIKTMQESDVSVLAIEAGRAVVFDREEMIRLADSHEISIFALTERDQQIENG
ncbi:MAG: LpxI family protein [Desulfobacteraceae bacterium]|nr:LpxI family protein [Desulfobacteraceae bacterium]